jgi:hypothetical protein
MHPRPSSIVCAGLLVLLVLLAGCSARHGADQGNVQVAQQAAGTARQLAYEHEVDIDTAPDRVASTQAAGLRACRDATAACTLLASSIEGAPNAAATLTFRARPDVISKLVAAMGQHAELARQSTRAEDLSAPIADAARQLAMLDDYRTRLEALRSRAGNDIEALIKVNQALVEVQANYEAAAGKRALLGQRVETEILKVSIGSARHRPFWTPVGQALREFGGHLAEGISTAITGLAYLIPWLVPMSVLGWGGRRLWRRRRGGKISAG